MSSEVAQPNGPAEPLQVDFGKGHHVSMQTVQHIYNEITGKTEEITKSYRVNHSANFDDLKQLNIKIQQLFEQYNVISYNCSVTLFHLNDQKEVFSSFERFQLYDRSTLSPVDQVRLEYHLLICLPKSNKPQSYSIEVSLRSRAAIIKRAKTESAFQADFLYHVITPVTARVEITYVDYTVARNFQVAIDSWIHGLPTLPKVPLIRPAQLLIDYYPFCLRILSALAFSGFCFSHFDLDFFNANAGPFPLFRALLLLTTGTFVVSAVGGRLGGELAKAAGRLQQPSYLNLTRGDDIAFAELKSDNRSQWTKFASSALLAVLINVFSSWVALKIGLQ